MNKAKVAILIGSAFDAKGFKKAETATEKLTKTFKNLGLALSAAAIVKFGKDAAKAFIQDEKEAARLTQTVKNLGLELSNPAISRYIDSLSEASAVTDSELRPAFQALLTTTGSVTASQKALQQAIDISVGSGIELTTVSQDLANAYVGNTRGLKKYNLGLTQAELKTASFEEVAAKLNKQYSGANAAYLDTYAGKLQKLTTAAGESQEALGAAVIELGIALTGSSDIDDLIGKISTSTDFAVARLDNFIEGWRLLKAIIKSSPGEINKAIQRVQVDEYNRRLARDYMKVWEGIDLPMSDKEKAAQIKAEAAARKRAAELAKLTKKNTAELAKQNAIKKASTLFDMEKIQIIAALKGKVTDEERKRLELQMAIATENVDEAKKLTYQLAISQGLTESLAKTLADLPAAKNPFASWEAYLNNIEAQAKRVASMSFGTGGAGTTSTGGGMALPSSQDLSGFSFAPEILAAIKAAPPIVNVTLDGQQLTSQITVNQQNNSLSGITPTEQRLFGSF